MISSIYFSLSRRVRQVIFLLVLFLLIATAILIIYWSIKIIYPSKSSGEIQSTFFNDTLIEGIYYGQYTKDPNCEAFPVNISKIGNEPNNFQISAENLVINFRFDEKEGTLFSPSLDTGTIEFDNKSSEIIITFKGWKFKRNFSVSK